MKNDQKLEQLKEASKVLNQKVLIRGMCVTSLGLVGVVLRTMVGAVYGYFVLPPMFVCFVSCFWKMHKKHQIDKQVEQIEEKQAQEEKTKKEKQPEKQLEKQKNSQQPSYSFRFSGRPNRFPTDQHQDKIYIKK